MTNRIIPAEPIAPGEYINDEMEARGWTQEDLADIVGRSRAHINRLIAGRTAITPETAHELAKAFGTDAQLWMNLQVSFELALAAKEHRGIEQRAKLYAKAPIRDMIRRGWIQSFSDTELLEKEVCKFLRVPSIDDEPALPLAARKSTEYGKETPEQWAWYCRAWQLAECTRAASFKDDAFRSAISELRSFAENVEDVRRVPAFLADVGVRLVLVEGLPKSKIDGVAIWLDENTPAIALSLRYDRIDNFWHTLMHEVIHIKYRHKSTIDVDLDASCGADVPEMERIANTEAAQSLVPSDKLESFVVRTRPLYYQTKIIQFAQARGVHPGVVVGQLQRRGELGYQQLRKLLVKFRDRIIGQAITDGWGNSPSIRN